MGNLADMTYLHPAAPGNGLQRLLIPIDASTESRWGLRHAVQLAAAGQPVDVCLLYVAEPVRNWEVLRFYSEDEVRQHFQERAAIFLEEAAETLHQAGLPCRRFFREADPVGGIIDRVDLYKDENPAIVSSAYYVFEPKDKEELLPEYLMMWLCRPENDRYIGFISH